MGRSPHPAGRPSASSSLDTAAAGIARTLAGDEFGSRLLALASVEYAVDSFVLRLPADAQGYALRGGVSADGARFDRGGGSRRRAGAGVLRYRASARAGTPVEETIMIPSTRVAASGEAAQQFMRCSALQPATPIICASPDSGR